MQEISVSTLVRYLKNKLDNDNNLQKVLVSGEISNYHRHYSGHLYFTLKDDNASISCVMFKSYTSSLTFEPKTGDKVIVSANISIFETSGQLQLYVYKINLDGQGDLYAQYEKLKNDLTKEGIFEQSHKINLKKKYLDKVAVLVGDKSAAMSDIKTIFNRRWPMCQVDYYPTLVQGNDAPENIIDILKKVDKLDYDAIVLARGGGSFEDLFCFNSEKLVRCIYELKTFLVTGIGHEQDFTLSDFVADLRAATPTAAIELITPNINDVKLEIIDTQNYLQDCINQLLNNNKMNLDYYLEKIINYQQRINNIKLNIDNNVIQIKNSLNLKFENVKLNLKRYSTLLDAYSCQNTLKRGYALIMQNNKIVNSSKKIKNDEFEIKFYDGSIKAKEI